MTMSSERPPDRPRAESSQELQEDPQEEAPGLGWRAALGILRRLPQGALSRGAGWVAERRIPRGLRRRVIRGFAGAVGADLSEAEEAPEAYASISEFFTRRLEDGARDWPDDPEMPGSPVDGVVGALGAIRDGELIQAKGIRYRVEELLGEGPHSDPFHPSAGHPVPLVPPAGSFARGRFLTLYLGPRHYHRIHAPVTGGVRWARALPGALLPVNAPAVQSVPDLFPRNERLVAILSREDRAPVAVVAVGAYNVGRISARFDEGWNGPQGRGVTNRRGRRGVETRAYDPPREIQRGEELMAFHLGSTVVLLFADEPRDFDRHLQPGREVALGQPLFPPSRARG